MVAWVSIPSVKERAMKMPGAMVVLEKVASEVRGLRTPKAVDLTVSLGNGDNIKGAITALIIAGYLETIYYGGKGGVSQIGMTDLGWQAIGQTRPLWL